MIDPFDLKSAFSTDPFLRELLELPSKVEALQRRIEELELVIASAPEAATGERCPKCSKLTYKFDRTVEDPTFGALGVQRDYYRCSSCGYEKFTQID